MQIGFFKIREVLNTKQISLSSHTELIQLTSNRGAALSEEFVANELKNAENHVAIYDRIGI